MVESIAFAGGIRVELQDCALEAPEGVVVHHDGDAGRVESVPLLRSVLLDGDSEARAAAPQEVPDAENRAGEVRLALQAFRRFGRDAERGRGRGHKMPIV